MALHGKILKRALKLNRKLNITRQSIQTLQTKTLRKLLSSAARTEFGKHYAFERILNDKDIVQAYRESVPFFDYDRLYEEWWHRLIAGERDITWPGKIENFALSSGTTGSSSKKIPISHEMLLSMRKASFRHLCAMSDFDLPKNFFEKDMLMLGGSTHLEQVDHLSMGDLSGILTGNLPIWMNKFYKPGHKISKERDWNIKLDLIAQEAHKWDIGAVAGVPAWVQMLFERILKHYQVDSIHDIWPNFRIYVHGGVAFQPYQKHFNTLLGEKVIFLETYLASEGFIAFERLHGAGTMGLVLRNGIYYEFIPFNAQHFSQDGELLPGAQAIDLSEVNTHDEYALVISTNAGAWRYLIGDTVRFTDVNRQELVITGRIKHFLSMCGEHLSVGNMNDAVSRLNEKLNLDIKEFSVVGSRSGEYFAHQWWLGADHDMDTDTIGEKLDAILCELNDDYKTERTAALREIRVSVIPNQLFYDWMKANNKMGGSHKFPRVLSKIQLASWQQFLSKENSPLV